MELRQSSDAVSPPLFVYLLYNYHMNQITFLFRYLPLTLFVIGLFALSATYALAATFVGSSISDGEDYTATATFGDIDGDGDLDLYVITDDTGPNNLWINDGDGNFTLTTISGDGGNSSDAVFGDIDGDGDLDLYVANYLSDQNNLWINDGDGNFTLSNFADEEGDSSEAILVDIDGDSDLDIYVVNNSLEQNRLWINDGDGNFTADDIVGDEGRSFGAAIGDIDGDGDMDIYVTNVNGEQNRLWINDGSENFTANDIAGDTDGTQPIMADFDGDNDLDIYVVKEGQNKLWINDGDANFTANDIAGDDENALYAVAADFDNDGDIDIYVANYEADNVLWINDGDANFTANDIAGDGDLHYTSGVAAGDVNGDSLIDLYITDYDEGNPLLLINTTGVGPEVETLSPADNAVGVEVETDLVITFSEAVTANSGNISLYKSTGDELIEAIDVTSGQVVVSTTTVTINPAVDLETDTDYYLTVASTAFLDIDDNAFAGISLATTWNFTTEEAVGVDDDSESEDSENTSSRSRSGGTSIQGRVSNLYKLGMNEEAEALKQKWGHLFEDETKTPELHEMLSALRTLISLAESLGLSIPQSAYQLIGTQSGIVRDLEFGMEGTDVRLLQNLLVSENAGPAAQTLQNVGPNGYFGNNTRAALAEYQAIHGIVPASGYFGPVTRVYMKNAGVPNLWW